MFALETAKSLCLLFALASILLSIACMSWAIFRKSPEQARVIVHRAGYVGVACFMVLLGVRTSLEGREVQGRTNIDLTVRARWEAGQWSLATSHSEFRVGEDGVVAFPHTDGMCRALAGGELALVTTSARLDGDLLMGLVSAEKTGEKTSSKILCLPQPMHRAGIDTVQEPLRVVRFESRMRGDHLAFELNTESGAVVDTADLVSRGIPVRTIAGAEPGLVLHRAREAGHGFKKGDVVEAVIAGWPLVVR